MWEVHYLQQKLRETVQLLRSTQGKDCLPAGFRADLIDVPRVVTTQLPQSGARRFMASGTSHMMTYIASLRYSSKLCTDPVMLGAHTHI